MRKFVIAVAFCLLAAGVWAQDNQDTQQGQQPQPWQRMHMERGMMGPAGAGLGMPPGAWWKNSAIVQKINLSDSQVQQIESIFQQDRANLENAGRAVREAEMALRPMIDAAQLNDAQINAQLETVLQARMNLERTHAQMLLSIRKVLTSDQWTTLKTIGPPEKPHTFERRMRKPPTDEGAAQPPQG
jgi:Spy/CpxP family protein refolding chaperone